MFLAAPSRTTRTLASTLIIITAAAGLLLWAYSTGQRDAAPIIASTAPRIEDIREIAKLAVLEVHVADVIEGRNAGGRALVLVHGDADLAVDWSAIEVAATDAEQRVLTLNLPEPQVERARVDHDRTRVYEVVKTGVAAWNPFADPRPALLEDCMRAAQQSIDRAARDPAFVAQARLRTESLLTAYHQRLGWRTAIRWSGSTVGKDAARGGSADPSAAGSALCAASTPQDHPH